MARHCARSALPGYTETKVKGGTRARRSELAWQRRTVGRLAKRNGETEERVAAPKRRRGMRLPALQWSGAQTRHNREGGRPRSAVPRPLATVRLLAVSAAVAGAAMVTTGPIDCMEHRRLDPIALVCGDGGTASWTADLGSGLRCGHGGSFRYGEARHPGPSFGFDDPEAYGEEDMEDVDQEHGWLGVSEADGALGAGMDYVEMSVQEPQGYIGPEDADLLGAATAIGAEEEAGGVPKPWWDVRLGEVIDEEQLEVEEATQEHLLAVAFP